MVSGLSEALGELPTLQVAGGVPVADGVTILWLWVAASRAPAPLSRVFHKSARSEPFRGPSQPFGPLTTLRPLSRVSTHLSHTPPPFLLPKAVPRTILLASSCASWLSRPPPDWLPPSPNFALHFPREMQGGNWLHG